MVTNLAFNVKKHDFVTNFEVIGSEQLNMVGEEPSTPMLLEAKTGAGSFQSATLEVLGATVEFTEAGAEAEFKE